jgi:hypothetical protein
MHDARTPAQTPARKAIRRWRAHNRRRWELEKDVLPVDTRAPFVCECTSDECLKPVELTMHEYEAAHMCPNWFAVCPGHILADDGGVVLLREPHFWVVEMRALPGARPSSVTTRGMP